MKIFTFVAGCCSCCTDIPEIVQLPCRIARLFSRLVENTFPRDCWIAWSVLFCVEYGKPRSSTTPPYANAYRSLFTPSATFLLLFSPPLSPPSPLPLLSSPLVSSTLLKASSMGPIYALRWFTPGGEVDLCGHATLAAAFTLWEEGRVGPGLPIRFSTASGVLTCRRDAEGWVAMDFPSEVGEMMADAFYILAEILVVGVQV